MVLEIIMMEMAFLSLPKMKMDVKILLNAMQLGDITIYITITELIVMEKAITKYKMCQCGVAILQR